MPELVGRHKRLSFMKVGSGTGIYKRMTKFTSLSESKTPQEYTRHYIDRLGEDTDVVGYSATIGFSFDRHTDTDVHDKLAEIIDDEKLGTEAHVEIVTVDIFDPSGEDSNTCNARYRKFAVVPDSVGDGTDALIYSGNFKAVSDMKKGTATTSDNWETITFSEAE